MSKKESLQNPKKNVQKRQRCEDQSHVESQSKNESGQDESTDRERENSSKMLEDQLVDEGSKLSGSKLRAFLKKNFLDFADGELSKIEALSDTVQ